jgi:GT2 family glycosyltransferase
MTNRCAVCVTVLNRYDLLRDLLISLGSSSIRPVVYIIDNGSNEKLLKKIVLECSKPNHTISAISSGDLLIMTESPNPSYGLAESWNRFIQATRKDGFNERIISNDDVKFDSDSLRLMTEEKGDIVFPAGVGFSCFLIRNSCVDKVGLFDESLSPGFAYFEDCDYMFRIDEHNKNNSNPVVVCDVHNVGIDHLKCGTQKVQRTPDEILGFRRRYYTAQENFLAKWGRLPAGLRKMSAEECGL